MKLNQISTKIVKKKRITTTFYKKITPTNPENDSKKNTLI